MISLFLLSFQNFKTSDHFNNFILWGVRFPERCIFTKPKIWWTNLFLFILCFNTSVSLSVALCVPFRTRAFLLILYTDSLGWIRSVTLVTHCETKTYRIMISWILRTSYDSLTAIFVSGSYKRVSVLDIIFARFVFITFIKFFIQHRRSIINFHLR